MPDNAPTPEASLQIYCCFTPAHEILFSKEFRPSIPSGFSVIPHTIDLTGRGDFLSREFLECIRMKVGLIAESIQQNLGNVIIWSDVDILFFATTPAEIKNALGNADISFQRETRTTSEVNTGFFVCRCNQRTLVFFQKVAEVLSIQTEINEQMAVNHLLLSPDLDLQWSTLPLSFYARTHGWPPPADLSIYHANYTMGKGGIERKLQQFKEVRFLRKYGIVSYVLSVLKFGSAKFLRKIKKTT